MCFSNLPVTFDEEGNPYLAEEAAEVSRPTSDDAASGTDGTPAHENEERPDSITADPRGAYEAIVASVSAPARSDLEELTDEDAAEADADAAEGD